MRLCYDLRTLSNMSSSNILFCFKDPGYKDFIYHFRHLNNDELNNFPRKFK